MFAFQVSTVDEDDDGMWQHVYGGEDEGTTEEEMTSSANRRPEAGSESEAGGCGLEEEAIHDRTMTVASPVHRLQAVSEPVLSVVDYTDDILQHAKSREVIRLFFYIFFSRHKGSWNFSVDVDVAKVPAFLGFVLKF